MRIAVLLYGFPEVSQTFIVSQLQSLSDLGHDVRVHAFVRGSLDHLDAATRESPLVRRAVFFGMPPAGPRRAAGALRRLAFDPAARRALRPSMFARWRPEITTLRLPYALAGVTTPARYDVVHAHFGVNGNVALPLRDAALLTGPLVTSFHGEDAGAYPQRWGADVYRELFARGEAFTANSAFMRSKIEALGCPPERITMLPVGLFPDRFPYHPRPPVVDGAVRFLTIGRLVEKKGIGLAIAAFARCAKTMPAAEYTIVGEGSLRSRLEAQVRDLGLQERVHLVGRRDRSEIVELSRSMHIFVLASHAAADGDYEGQGLVLQEAQSLGMPVIASDHNGFPDSVLDGVSGHLVPEGDEAALAARMVELAQAPGRWEDMGRAGRTFVRERFDQDRLTQRLVELYTSLSA